MLKRNFTEEQQQFRNAYRRFLQKEIAPNMERWAEQGMVDREAFLKAGEQGFLMIWPEEQYGGLGLTDFRYEQIIIEETNYALCGDWYNTLHSRLVGPYIQHFGNEEQKQRLLPGCISGEKILAVAMTEPDAGSDLAGMRATAKDMGDHWLLNGAKTFISNGILADLVIVAAKTDPEHNPHAMGLFVVERGMEGFERGRKLKKMGLKAQDTAELFFNNVKVPKSNVLGDPKRGFYQLMQGLAEERLIGCVQFLASANKRSTSPSTSSSSARRSASASPISRTPSSAWPACARSWTSPRPMSTSVSPNTTRVRSPRWMPPRASSTPANCRDVWWTSACSCTAAPATWMSTPSPASTPTPASPASSPAAPK